MTSVPISYSLLLIEDSDSIVTSFSVLRHVALTVGGTKLKFDFEKTVRIKSI